MYYIIIYYICRIRYELHKHLGPCKGDAVVLHGLEVLIRVDLKVMVFVEESGRGIKVS